MIKLNQFNANYQLKNKKETSLNTFLIVLFVFIFIIYLCYFCFCAIFIKAEVIGISMCPTYNVNLDAINVQTKEYYESSIYKDKILANRYEKGDNGDVVLINFDNETIIKRIIAMSNQKLSLVREGDVYCYYLNDEKLVENYLYNLEHMNYVYFIRFCNMPNIDIETDNVTYATIIIPEGYVFALGDNRLNSYDCSSFGPIQSKNILGKVCLSYDYNQTLIEYIWQLFCGLFS